MNTVKTKPAPSRKHDRLIRGFVAVIMAVVFNHFADRLLGAHIEIFTGIEYFSPFWVTAMFLVPFIDGLITSSIYGFGGKWLALLPPVIVRCISYFEILNFSGVAKGAHLLPLGWWVLFVFLVMQSSLLGGIVGEVLNKRAYGRSSKHLVHKDGKVTEKTDQAI